MIENHVKLIIQITKNATKLILFCDFACVQKSVVVPVNAISPLNEKHLQDKLSKLVCVLNGSAVPLDNTMFRATEHPLGVLFCTNVLAKTFVVCILS